LGFVSRTARGLTPMVALVAFVGGVIAPPQHRSVALWLIPPVGLPGR